MLNLSLILDTDAEVQLPRTLKLDKLVQESDYELQRAPFSSVVVLSGDGLPKPEPLVVEGKVYPGSTNLAADWIRDFTGYVERVKALRLTDEASNVTNIPVYAADIVVLPVGLPRILKVKMRFFPK